MVNVNTIRHALSNLPLKVAAGKDSVPLLLLSKEQFKIKLGQFLLFLRSQKWKSIGLQLLQRSINWSVYN